MSNTSKASKFFKPEDFDLPRHELQEDAARQANAKLEREGQVVHGNFGINNHNEITHEDLNPAHKALLINIEDVEQCKHPVYKIHHDSMEAYQCSCGAIVKPTKFEEVE